jgi:SAM-dependent methyltransferase
MATRALVHDRLSTLADPTRGRVLLLLEAHELTVGELCQVLQLPQSTVSRHLRVLGDERWIVSRQDGTSRFYALDPHLEPAAERLWRVVREDLRGSVVENDQARLASVIAQRASRSRRFFAASAAQWDVLRAELFGGSADLVGLLGLLDEDWTVGDLGCGTGRLTEVLAPNVARVIGVDASPEMLAGARARLSHLKNVEFRAGELEGLPIEAGTLNAAVLSLVLHYVPEPAAVLHEVFRTLTPGGRVLIVDMQPHERSEYPQQMGHVWLGFSESQLTSWLGEAGLTPGRYRRLPPEPTAKGPSLFAVSARKPVTATAAFTRGQNGRES